MTRSHRDLERGGGIAAAQAAGVRIGHTSHKSIRIESVVDCKVRHVFAHSVSEVANHSRRGSCGRLEEKRRPIDVIHHPRMLTTDLWPIVTDHAAHTELGLDADLC